MARRAPECASNPADFADRFVCLRDGFVVPVEPYLLLLELESRGFAVTAEGSRLFVGPTTQLTDHDRDRIRRHKRHLLNLIAYCQRPGLDTHLFEA